VLLFALIIELLWQFEKTAMPCETGIVETKGKPEFHKILDDANILIWDIPG
jgi:hypothetical protein